MTLSRPAMSAGVMVGLLAAGAAPAGPAGQDASRRSYYVYVAAESDDEVAIVRYGPAGAEVVKTVVVGSYPAEVEGPHGLNVDPDGRHWYVSIAHGFPYGSVHKYETGTDAWVGDVTLGLFPATLDVSAATGLLFAVNFNLHGPLETSSISVVEVDTMTEVVRVDTGVRPHGGRLSPDGSVFYSVNMMDFELVELDAFTFEITRRLSLGDGVMPTWVSRPTPDGKVYVTGNNVARIFEIDLASWRIERTFETGAGPYNLDVSADGTRLVATYKNGDAVGFWDLETRAGDRPHADEPYHSPRRRRDPGRRARVRHPGRRRRRSRNRRDLPVGHRRAGRRRRRRQTGGRHRLLEAGGPAVCPVAALMVAFFARQAFARTVVLAVPRQNDHR